MSYQGWSDFRSDTVTRPTPAMRKAMAEAEVGDDVLGDDPTVIRLQELAAAAVGKEAALFVPSGTMGNTIALMVHGCRGREVMLEEKSHIYNYENGNISSLAGAVPRPLPSAAGRIDLLDLGAVYKGADDEHEVRSAGICLENTHNYHGGSILPPDYVAAVARFARGRNLFLHLDGARLFHAATALHLPVADLAQPFDSLMFCLSKGLCAPVGSILAGSRDFIREARHLRKALGGGMRQVGVLAAAGILALTEMSGRLAEDHRRARRLAERAAALPGLDIDPGAVQSNIVIFRVTRPEITAVELVRRLEKNRVLALPFGAGRVRMVTHHDIDDPDVDRAAAALADALGD